MHHRLTHRWPRSRPALPDPPVPVLSLNELVIEPPDRIRINESLRHVNGYVVMLVARSAIEVHGKQRFPHVIATFITFDELTRNHSVMAILSKSPTSPVATKLPRNQRSLPPGLRRMFARLRAPQLQIKHETSLMSRGKCKN